MPTARDIITLAMKEAGVLGVGQTLLSEDINDGMTYLRRMMSVWQKKRWLVPALYDLAMPGNNLISNKIGPGQYWNAARPDKIQSAYIIQQVEGGTPVSIPCKLIFSYEDYSRIVVKNLNSMPYSVFYDGAYPYGNVFFFPIPDETYECHLILKGNINWQQQILTGQLTAGGSGYNDGVIAGVPLIGGGENQQGAIADITVDGGAVIGVEITFGGQNYLIGDVLTAGEEIGAGVGFLYTVTNTTISLDSEFNMPEEYEEAIHYNLAVRLYSAYDKPVSKDTRSLAKSSLNTIRVANTQIPTLGMPAGLRRTNGFSLWDPDGYGVNG
jgi:hypothetical protein